MSIRLASVAVLVAFSLPVIQAAAQQDVPAAPAAEPSVPAPAAAPVFPKIDPVNFTATTPSKETVETFLRTSWGYDDTRVWQVAAIQKTTVEGISKVIVYLGDKTGKQKLSGLQFFALADGKHIIAGDEIIPFGEHPYADAKAMALQKADGPYRGAAAKDFEIVEFADFQCPHCKEAQANMDKLAVDFPKARIVFQNYPLPQHPAAAGAAAYGLCVAKQGGSTAFFTFAATVFDGQDGLATPDGATLTLNSAVTKAGLDPAKIADCAKSPATLAAVDASVKLAKDLNINQTPTILVNGRPVPANAPYDTVKQIVQYQAKLDGVAQ
ncbi:MAG TPA: thioredoxin domain-containing protein [Terracidiphilus sp.]|nr:thioredoxin domain-containing protein [Terracidiphilus sp.]